MKLKNLNGWQRLWVLLSAIWLVVVFGLVVVDAKSEDAFTFILLILNQFWESLLLWLISSLAVYFLAWGGWRVVVWVWRGFKKGESNE